MTTTQALIKDLAHLADSIDTSDMTLSQPDSLSHVSRHPPAQHGVDYRSIDGSGNNLTHTDYNAAGSDFTRIGDAHFADGVDAMTSGPNPRMISNVVVGQGDADVPNAEGLSGMMYAWGQFIDHDLDLSRKIGRAHV